IELVFPFLIFFPRRARITAAFGILALQTVISLTGNYNFFNLTVMTICIALFDDAAFKFVLPQRVTRLIERHRVIKPPGKMTARLVSVAACIIVLASGIQLAMALGLRLPGKEIVSALAPLRIINTYGPFAVMTKQRREIIVEGSDDGEHWQEYEF